MLFSLTPVKRRQRLSKLDRATRTAPAFEAAIQPVLEMVEPRLLMAAGVPQFDHVVVVIEENHSYSDVIGSSAAPFINSLAKQGANFTNSFAVTHPSQPNYLELFSGDSQGVSDDSTPGGTPFSTPNLGAELAAGGKTFVGYSEDLPSVGYTGSTSGDYARKHNPWVNWQASNAPASNHLPSSDNQPFSAFPSDFSKLPTLSIVVPNLANDMHDGSIQQGDQWLSDNLGAYANWAKSNNSLLVVTWDEDDSSASNHIPTIFSGADVRAGNYSETIDHHDVLRTLEDMYGLSHAGAAASASPITDVWGTAPTVTSPAAPSNLSASAVSSSQIDLSWKDNSTNETGFEIDHATDSSFTQNLVTSTTGAGASSYHANGLSASTKYFFRVRATNSAGDSANSNMASATTESPVVTIPFAPSGLALFPVSSSQIDLMWTESSANQTSFRIDRATDSNFTQNLVASSAAASATGTSITGLSPDTTYFFRVFAVNSGGSSGSSNVGSATTAPAASANLPADWSAQDISAPALDGSSSYSNGTYTVRGAGSDIWGSSDQFQFASQNLSGDGTIIARVAGMSNTDSWAKSGVMIRQTSAAGSASVDLAVTAGHGAGMFYRSSSGATSSHILGPSTITAPYWLKLVRTGDTITGSISSDGSTWALVGSVTIAMGADVQIGLAVTSHNPAATNVTTFDNVSVSADASTQSPRRPRRHFWHAAVAEQPRQQ